MRKSPPKHTLTNEQIHILKTIFKLRILQMKDGKLRYEDYVASGKYYEDLDDAYIHGIMDQETFLVVNELFRDELIKACYNPEMYNWLTHGE